MAKPFDAVPSLTENDFAFGSKLRVSSCPVSRAALRAAWHACQKTSSGVDGFAVRRWADTPMTVVAMRPMTATARRISRSVKPSSRLARPAVGGLSCFTRPPHARPRE